MPLVALKRSSGRRIDVREFHDVRVEVDCSDLVCPMPDCGVGMVAVRGTVVTPHFRHRAPCTTRLRVSWGGGPESEHHLAGKRAIARDVLAFLEKRGVKDAAVDYEVPFPDIARVADVVVTLPGGERLVYECQLAAISVEELRERTNDYAAAGLPAFWYLGGKAAVEANKGWALHEYGGVNLIEFDGPTPAAPWGKLEA